MAGHIFVVRGDMTRQACDAWLLPTDDEFDITHLWSEALGVTPGPLAGQVPWRNGERIRRFTDADEDRARIWLGLVGADGKTAEWYADAGCEFVRTVGIELAGDERQRPPLLAINHLGTGRGGAHLTKGDVLKTLFTRLHETIDALDTEVDVVVVGWDAAGHSAAQRARLEVLADRASRGGTSTTNGPTDDVRLNAAIARWDFVDAEAAPRLRRKAVALADAARERNLSVFMGAGVSAGAGLPTWNQLLTDIADIAGVDVEELERFSDPRDRAALLDLELEKKGQDLSELVATRLRHSHHSLQHALLSGLPSNEFITTNFDELFEEAATTNGRELRVIPPRRRTETDCPRWLLKLHGTVSDHERIVLTRGSYIEAPMERGALLGLVQAMLMTREMMFVGYGLNDEDFHTLVHQVRMASPREFRPHQGLGTALTVVEEPTRAKLWESDVDIVPMLSRSWSGDSTRAVAVGGREIEKFLDLVGMLAADRTAFLLDARYQGMLDESEVTLADALESVRAAVSRRPMDEKTDGWRALESLLRSMGAD